MELKHLLKEKGDDNSNETFMGTLRET